MKRILVIGAGRSSPALIKYFLDHSGEMSWEVTVGDLDPELARKTVDGHPRASAVVFDVSKPSQRKKLIGAADIVVSLLPPHLHIEVARDCIRSGKNLATASYVSDDIRKLHRSATKAGVLLMNEVGVDPGLDHMSAMQSIEKIRAAGGELTSFKSYAGGLVAPEFDNNPWRYKFTWNPKNVVTAGRGVVKFRRNERFKYIPYHRLFTRLETISVLDAGKFEAYPNRDSLDYREVYGLQDIPTIFRGTLRRPGFCEAWNVFVQLGITDDTYTVEDSEHLTYREFLNSFLKYSRTEKAEVKLQKLIGGPRSAAILKKIKWLGLFEDRPVGLADATPAEILQKLLEEKWALEPGDRDMIVMCHQFEYRLPKSKRRLTSSLVTVGHEQPFTAMARTVGLPLAIVVKLILLGKVRETGVHIPILPSVYEPVLDELKAHGISFVEKSESIRA